MPYMVPPTVLAFYFLFYGAVGIYLMFFAPHLRGLGFSGSWSPCSARSLGSAAPSVWASVADRLDATTRTLRWCMLAALIPLLFLLFAKTSIAVAAVNVAHQVSAPVCVPLIDSLTFEWLNIGVVATPGSGSTGRSAGSRWCRPSDWC